MNQITLFTILFLCSFVSLQAQHLTKAEATSIAKQLYTKKVLSQACSETLVREIEQNTLRDQYISSKEDTTIRIELKRKYILSFIGAVFREQVDCRSLAEQQANPRRREDAMYSVAFGGGAARALTEEQKQQLEQEKERKKIAAAERNKEILDALFSTTLIEEDIYKIVQVAISKYSSPTPMDVLSNCLRQLEGLEQLGYEQRIQIKHLDELEAVGILSASNKEKLMASYVPYKLKSKLEVMSYCNNMLHLEKSDFPEELVAANEKIITEIKKMIPALMDIDFKVDTAMRLKEDEIYFEAAVSFEDKGTYYESYSRQSVDQVYASQYTATIDSDIARVINNWLKEEASAYRLFYDLSHFISRNEEGQDELHFVFTMFLLTEEQCRVWSKHFFNIPPTYFAMYDNTMNKKEIRRTINEWKEIGLFSHLDEKTIEKNTQEALYYEVNNYKDLLRIFDKLTIDPVMAYRYVTLEYMNFLQDLAILSKGEFSPTAITDVKNIKSRYDKFRSVSFEYNGKAYTKDLKIVHQFDPEIVSLIRSAMEDNKTKGKFYSYNRKRKDHRGYYEVYFYVEDEQYAKLQEKYPSLFIKEPEELEDRRTLLRFY